MRWSSGTAFMVVAGVVGCSDPSTSEPERAEAAEQAGGFGNVTFSYGCAGAGDAQCNVDSQLAPRGASGLPRVALGTSFLLSTRWDLMTDPPKAPLVISAVPGKVFGLKVDGDRTVVTALAAGYGSFVVAAGADIADVATLDARPIDHLRLIQASPRGDFTGGSVDLDLGRGSVTATADVKLTFKFRVVAADAEDHLLAGALPIKWQTLDSNVLKLVSADNDNIATFESGAPGTTRAVATVGDRKAEVTITVGSGT